MATVLAPFGWATRVVPLQGFGPRGSRVNVFQQIFDVFLLIGTLVGVVVVGYMLYNAYKYRDGSGHGDDAATPELGEIPSGGGKGKKLFLSFAISTIIVVSLIVWTYSTLLYVEASPPTDGEDAMVVEVEGYQFGWDFIYPNNKTTSTLRVPEDRPVKLKVTSRDVFHNFGIPALRAKADAIPGQETETWLIANETGNYTANCYELCGPGHSFMTADVVVMEQDEFQDWYRNDTTARNASLAD